MAVTQDDHSSEDYGRQLVDTLRLEVPYSSPLVLAVAIVLELLQVELEAAEELLLRLRRSCCAVAGFPFYLCVG